MVRFTTPVRFDLELVILRFFFLTNKDASKTVILALQLGDYVTLTVSAKFHVRIPNTGVTDVD